MAGFGRKRTGTAVFKLSVLDRELICSSKTPYSANATSVLGTTEAPHLGVSMDTPPQCLLGLPLYPYPQSKQCKSELLHLPNGAVLPLSVPSQCR